MTILEYYPTPWQFMTIIPYFGNWARSMSGNYENGNVIYQSIISRNTACLFPLLSRQVHTQGFYYCCTSLCIIFHSGNVYWLSLFVLHIVKIFSTCSQPWVCEAESIWSYFALKQTSDPSHASKQMLSAQNLNSSPNHLHPEDISTKIQLSNWHQKRLVRCQDCRIPKMTAVGCYCICRQCVN